MGSTKLEQEVLNVTMEVPVKETEQLGKDKGKVEAMEVNVEVEISLEYDNKYLTTDKFDNHFHGCLLIPKVDELSVENNDLIQYVELSSISNEGDDNVGKFKTTFGDLEAKSMSQISDTFTFICPKLVIRSHLRLEK